RKVPAERPSMAEVVAALDRLRTGLTAPSGPEAPGALPPAAGVGANGAAAPPVAIPSPPWGLAPSASSGSVSAPLPGALPSPLPHAPPVEGARPTPNRPLLQPRGEREEEREERAEARPTPNRPLLQPLLWLGAGLGLGLLVALGVLLRSGRGQQPPAPPAPSPPATAAAPPSAAATQKSSEPASAEPVRRSAGRRSSHSSRGETPSDGGGPEGGSGEERPLRLSRNPLDQQLARLAAQVAPGQRQVGRLQAGYGRQGQEQHRYVDLSAGRCYTFVSVGAPPMEALYAYLWDPRGRRVATEKDSGRQPVVWHCAAMSGRYHFLVKAAGGDGEYRSAVFVR
ncbi:MAG: hypothetical protein NZ890_22740, partial [Myxococcota bacterium]|nr:hypothetical protein [Myxococcota bacterium]